MTAYQILCAIKSRLYPNPRPSLNDLDRKLEKYLNYKKGFFIEAGANDGYNQSNTYYLETKRRWRGLLVEAIPDLYEKCKRTRRGSVVRHCALVAPDYPGKTATMHFANLMSVVEGSMKTEERQRQHLNTAVEVQRLPGTYSIDVPARTLESMLDEIPNLPEIDFLSLDVEGYELEVLRGLNLDKYRPAFILVEARFFEEVDTFLQKNAYELVEKLSEHDFLYKRAHSA